jgi:hypothetical protein
VVKFEEMMIQMNAVVRSIVAALVRLAKRWAAPGAGPNFVWC